MIKIIASRSQTLADSDHSYLPTRLVVKLSKPVIAQYLPPTLLLLLKFYKKEEQLPLLKMTNIESYLHALPSYACNDKYRYRGNQANGS